MVVTAVVEASLTIYGATSNPRKSAACKVLATSPGLGETYNPLVVVAKPEPPLWLIAGPVTWRKATGVVVPIPTLPGEVILNLSLSCDSPLTLVKSLK